MESAQESGSKQSGSQAANVSKEGPAVFVKGISHAAAKVLAAELTKQLAPAVAEALVQALADINTSGESDEQIDPKYVEDLENEVLDLREQLEKKNEQKPKGRILIKGRKEEQREEKSSTSSWLKEKILGPELK